MSNTKKWAAYMKKQAQLSMAMGLEDLMENFTEGGQMDETSEVASVEKAINIIQTLLEEESNEGDTKEVNLLKDALEKLEEYCGTEKSEMEDAHASEEEEDEDDLEDLEEEDEEEEKDSEASTDDDDDDLDEDEDMSDEDAKASIAKWSNYMKKQAYFFYEDEKNKVPGEIKKDKVSDEMEETNVFGDLENESDELDETLPLDEIDEDEINNKNLFV